MGSPSPTKNVVLLVGVYGGGARSRHWYGDRAHDVQYIKRPDCHNIAGKGASRALRCTVHKVYRMRERHTIALPFMQQFINPE